GATAVKVPLGTFGETLLAEWQDSPFPAGTGAARRKTPGRIAGVRLRRRPERRSGTAGDPTRGAASGLPRSVRSSRRFEARDQKESRPAWEMPRRGIEPRRSGGRSSEIAERNGQEAASEGMNCVRV